MSLKCEPSSEPQTGLPDHAGQLNIIRGLLAQASRVRAIFFFFFISLKPRVE